MFRFSGEGAAEETEHVVAGRIGWVLLGVGVYTSICNRLRIFMVLPSGGSGFDACGSLLIRLFGVRVCVCVCFDGVAVGFVDIFKCNISIFIRV